MRKVKGACLWKTLSHVRQSQRYSQGTDKKRCQGEINSHSKEKENEGMENDSGA